MEGEAQGRLLDVWGAHATLQLHLGDLDGYRATCTRLVRILKNQTGSALISTAWICVLGPGATSDPGKVVTLAERALATIPGRIPAGLRLTPQAAAVAASGGYTRGGALYRAGRYREAIDRLNESAKRFGTEGRVVDWIFLAMAHHRLGHAAEARLWLNKAVQWFEESTPQSPRDSALGIPVPWLNWLQVSLLRYEAEALVRGSPAKAEPDVRVAFARAHFRLGQWDRAAADFTRTLAQRPGNVRLLAERGQCLRHLGQWDKALADLEKAVEQWPDDPRLLATRGRCRLEVKQADRALADFTRAVELRRATFEKAPEVSAVRASLADAYRDQAEAQLALGRAADAAATLVHFRGLWPGHAIRLVEAARLMGRCIPAGDTAGKPIADQAMATLMQAVRAGHADPALRTDKDLEPLRAREDFRALMDALGRENTFAPPTGEVGRLRGHDTRHGVMAVAVSRDGRQAVSGGYDKTVRLWDVATGRELHRLTFTQTVFGVAIAPDGGTALVGSGESDLCLWDLRTGKVVRRLKGHIGWVTGVCFLPGGRALSAGQDNDLHLWDLAAGKELRRFNGHTSGVLRLAVSADGERALSGGYDHVLRLWDVKTGTCSYQSDAQPGTINAVALSADGRRGASACEDDLVRLWDFADRRGPRLLAGHWQVIRSVAFTPDGRRLLSTDNAGTAILWDVATGQELHRFRTTGNLIATAIFPDGRHALCGGANGNVLLWDLSEETAQARDCSRVGQFADAAAAYGRAVARRPVAPEVLRDAARFHARRGEDRALQGQYKGAEASWRQARAHFEKLLAARPTAENAAEIARFLKATAVRWVPLTPATLSSAAGATLTRQADDSVLASGKLPDTDTWTIGADTDRIGITALRLEVLPDARLPGRGPGRAGDGNFILTQITVTVAPKAGPGKAVAVPVRAAAATFTQDGWNVRGTLDDDNNTGWAIIPRSGQGHSAFFALHPVDGFAGGTHLTVKLAFRNLYWKKYALGRFRLCITTDANPLRGQALVARADVGGWTKLAAAYLDRGERPAALTALARAQAAAKGSAWDDFLLARAQAEAGRKEEARKILDRGFTRLVGTESDEVLRTLAVEALGPLLVKVPEDVGLRARRAHLLAQLGRREEAAADYRAIAAREPKQARWAVRLAQLTPGVVAFWNFDFDADAWQGADGKLTCAAGRLRVEATGPAAHFEARLTAPAGWYELTIRARSKGPLPTRLLLGKAGVTVPFAEARCQWFVLPASGSAWQDCKVSFVAEESFGLLRLETGAAGTVLELDALTLRKVASKGRGEELIRQTTAAIERLPRSWQARLARGDLYARLGRTAATTADFAAAAAMEPGETLNRHRLFASVHGDARNLPLALAHLDVLIRRETGKPDEAGLRFWRGGLLGRLSRWKEGTADYARGLELDPRDHWHWFCLVPLRLYTGDDKGYRADCARMLKRFGDTANVTIAERTAKTCLLAPLPAGGSDLPVQLAERAVTGTEKHTYHYWFRLAHGMAQYRTGDLAAARATLEKAREGAAAAGNNCCLAMANLYLALCYSRASPASRDRAKAALAEADRCMGLYFPKASRGDLGDWPNWLHCQITRREVETRLKEAARPAVPGGRALPTGVQPRRP